MNSLIRNVAFMISCSIAASAYADKPLNFGFGGYWWSTEVEGGLYGTVDPSFASTNNNQRLELSFDSFDKEYADNSSFFAYFEHSNKWLPNINLSYTTLINQGTDGKFFHPVLTKPADVLLGEIDVSHFDLSLYYNAINYSFVTLDLGLNARVIKGNLTLDTIIHYSSSDIPWKTSSEVSSELLLLYANLKFKMPLGFSIESTIMGGQNSSEKGLDASLSAQYKSPIGVAVGLGYRLFDSQLISETDDNNIITEIRSDLQFKGLFLQLSYHY